MKEYSMLQLADPVNKVVGDCYRTSIACILERDPETVPHFAESTWYDHAARKWLATEYGLMLVEMRLDRMSNGWALDLEKGRHDVHHLIVGKTERGTHHACVGRNGKLVWDPHPSRSGLTEIIGLEFLVPLDYANYTRCYNPVVDHGQRDQGQQDQKSAGKD